MGGQKASLIELLEVRSTHDVTREIITGVPLGATPSMTAANITSQGEPVSSQVSSFELELERSIGLTVVCTKPCATTLFTIESSVPHSSCDASSSKLKMSVALFILHQSITPSSTPVMIDATIVGLRTTNDQFIEFIPTATVTRSQTPGMLPNVIRAGSDLLFVSLPPTVTAAVTIPMGSSTIPLIFSPGRVPSGPFGGLVPTPIVVTLVASAIKGLPINSTPVQCMSMMPGQQLPPLSKFSGEDSDEEGECFEDWIEQFEAITTMY